MYVIHGTWIPDDPLDFVQRGAFYLWVETDEPAALGGAARSRKHTLHPKQLMLTELSTFLSERLLVPAAIAGAPEQQLELKYFLLPTVDERPAPSFELLRYVEEEAPTTFTLQPWQVYCYRVDDVIPTLNALRLMALQDADGFQLGADLVFWQQYTQVFKRIIARDQYIPAFKYQLLGKLKSKNKRTRDVTTFKLHPGWEIISDSYEMAVQRYSAAMPPICTAGSNDAATSELYDAESLLRHFSESLLHDVVTDQVLPVKFEQQVAGTLLQYCLTPEHHVLSSSEAFEDYQRWLSWRTSLTRSATDAEFRLCLRLEDAPATDVDNWSLHFLVAARHDPSLKLSLADYWTASPRERARLVRPYGKDFEKNLLLALGYAARIYPKIWDGLATAQPAVCRLTLDEAFAFLKESAWVLSDAGYIVTVPAWWTPAGRKRTKVRLKTSLRSAKKKSSASAGPARLSMDMVIAYEYTLSIGGQTVTEAEWRQLVQAKTPLVQFRGEWIELDREKMQQMLEFWQKHRDEESEISLLDMLKLESGAEDDLEWEHDLNLQEMLSHLNDKNALTPIEDPLTLQGTLRGYQRRGVAWLWYLEALGLNPCLADDMGLGKTIQVIALLLKEREALAEPCPTLIIAPTSVLGNWAREIARFAPHLPVLVHQGSMRNKELPAFKASCAGAAVVLTSFALARLDEKLLHGIKWQRVIVDEAQNIKNPQAAQTRAILKLPAPHRIALTGTPVENRLRDLWSIFNFLNPGYLGRETQFRKSFELPIYKNNDTSTSTTLKRLVEPFILRRVKTDKSIINDLPDKIEQKVYCTLSPEQASLYEAVVKDVEAQLEEAEGMQRRGLILATILRLKQICNHPMQFLQDDSAFTPERSHKLQRLGEMLEEVLESGESALIFTQFTEIGAALERYLEHVRHYNTYYLHGGTNVARRDQMVTDFQDAATEPSLFILSLRAGGVGLNLTKANHVFHFDRWWNPAVENQATDRAFRIGQQKNVFVHKFISIGTMEERIDEMIEDKKRLSSLVVGNDESWLTELDNDTFKDLIALRRSAVVE